MKRPVEKREEVLLAFLDGKMTKRKAIDAYKAFVMDHISYARELDKVKHLILEKT